MAIKVTSDDHLTLFTMSGVILFMSLVGLLASFKDATNPDVVEWVAVTGAIIFVWFCFWFLFIITRPEEDTNDN